MALPGERHGRSKLERALIVVGPLGLAIDVFASLWASHLHVTHSASVQVEPEWVPGEQLAVRTLLVDRNSQPFADVAVRLRYVSSTNEVVELGEIEGVDGGVSQGSFVVPEVARGDGELELSFTPPAALTETAVVERVPVRIVDRRPEQRGELSVAGSMLQWADDTDPQPEALRIDLRPEGRILAGFRNTFFVRVTDPAGRPHGGAVAVHLISGEFMDRHGDENDPPVLAQGSLDRLGMISLSGDLSSDVIRIEVEVAAPATPPTAPIAGVEVAGAPTPVAPVPPLRRRFRFVSYAGGVRVDAGTLAAGPGQTLAVQATALSARRPIFVDVHGPDGAWVDTLSPPLISGAEAREWTIPSTWTRTGLVQLEGYHFATSPDESSAVTRVLVSGDDQEASASLAPLIARQRELLDLPRIERDFDVTREREFLRELERAELDAAEVGRARAWLLGSLPVEVHGPPLATNTRAREEAAMAARKGAWIVGLRWFLLLGGALYLGVIGVWLWRTNRRVAAATDAALAEDADGTGDQAERVGELVEAKRQFVVRGVIVVAFVAVMLLLTIALLESLVWVV